MATDTASQVISTTDKIRTYWQGETYLSLLQSLINKKYVSQKQKGSTTRKSRSTTVCAATQSTGSPKTQKGSTTRKPRSTTVCGNTEYRKPEYEKRKYNRKVTKYHCVRQHKVQGARIRRQGVQQESHEVTTVLGNTEYRKRKNPLFSVHRLYQELKKRRLNFQGGTQASRTRTQFRLGETRGT